MRRYRLQKFGNLLAAKCAVFLGGEIRVLNLLVDTGSTYTIIPVEVLESLGCLPSREYERVRIITGSGYVIAPRIKVEEFHCLGAKIQNFPVVAHTLPPESIVDGLLGMDFLISVKANINVFKAIIEKG